MEFVPVIIGAFFWFFFGACIGSFLNVLVYRTEKGEDWVRGRSHCDECNKLIAWYDNIPLLSFLLLRGKCRRCHKPISIARPIVEALFGSLFLWWYLVGSFFFQLTEQPFVYIQPLFWLIVGILLIFIFVEDFLTMYIPMWSVAVLTILALAYRVALTAFGIMQMNDLLATIIAAAGLAGFFFALHVLTKGKGMGIGDVYLAFPLVLLVGWPRGIVWFFLSFFLGAAIGLVLMPIKKAKFGQQIPFGPFMIAGAVLTLIWGEYIWAWYISLLK